MIGGESEGDCIGNDGAHEVQCGVHSIDKVQRIGKSDKCTKQCTWRQLC